MPPKLLAEAIKRWAIKSPYMPKASELIALARDVMKPADGKERREHTAKELAARRNASGEVPDGLMWCGDEHGQLWLEQA